MSAARERVSIGRQPVDDALAALAEPTRRAVVELLRARPHRAGELADALGVTPPALSRHLRQLKACGIVADDEPADDARVRLYRLRPEALAPLDEWLAPVRAMWAEQLRAFQRHAANSKRRK